MAGVLEVPYRVFAVSVAISTAIWSGIWFALVARFGTGITQVLNRRPWLSLLVVALVGLVFASGALSVWRRTDVGSGPTRRP